MQFAKMWCRSTCKCNSYFFLLAQEALQSFSEEDDIQFRTLYIEERVKPVIAVNQGVTGKKKSRRSQAIASGSADNDGVSE